MRRRIPAPMPLPVIAFALLALALSSARAERVPDVILLEVGPVLEFQPRDILAAECVQWRRGASMALTISQELTRKLRHFTETMMGGEFTTISGNRVLSLGTKVISVISSREIHYSTTGLDEACRTTALIEQRRDAGRGPVIVNVGHVRKIELHAEPAPSGRNRDGAILLRIHPDSDFRALAGTAMDKMLLIVGETVVRDWSYLPGSREIRMEGEALPDDFAGFASEPLQ